MKKYIVLLSVALSFMFSGCFGSNAYVTNTGFFEDYDDVQNQEDITIDLSKYTKVIITPVELITFVPVEKQSASDKKLYTEISDYLNSQYKKILETNNRYTVVQSVSHNTLKVDTAVSLVEIHPDDKNWNPYSPITMGLNVVSYNAYQNNNVRLLGEKRLVDAKTKEVLARSIQTQNGVVVNVSGDVMEFKDIKPALDSWIKQIRADLTQGE